MRFSVHVANQVMNDPLLTFPEYLELKSARLLLCWWSVVTYHTLRIHTLLGANQQAKSNCRTASLRVLTHYSPQTRNRSRGSIFNPEVANILFTAVKRACYIFLLHSVFLFFRSILLSRRQERPFFLKVFNHGTEITAFEFFNYRSIMLLHTSP